MAEILPKQVGQAYGFCSLNALNNTDAKPIETRGAKEETHTPIWSTSGHL